MPKPAPAVCPFDSEPVDGAIQNVHVSHSDFLCMLCFPQAETELRIAQSEFDRQAEITRLLLEGISSTHVRSHILYVYQCFLLQHHSKRNEALPKLKG